MIYGSWYIVFNLASTTARKCFFSPEACAMPQPTDARGCRTDTMRCRNALALASITQETAVAAKDKMRTHLDGSCNMSAVGKTQREEASWVEPPSSPYQTNKNTIMYTYLYIYIYTHNYIFYPICTHTFYIQCM